MRRAYLPIASNTAVIRADALRAFGGFPKELRWFADSFACTALAMRHGACVLAEPLALIRSRPKATPRPCATCRNRPPVLNAVLDLLARPEMRDIRAFMKDCPSNLTVYDPLILKVLGKRARDWDLFAAYARWKIREIAAAMRARELPRRVANRFQEAPTLELRERRRELPERCFDRHTITASSHDLGSLGDYGGSSPPGGSPFASGT